jgi:hypothetical protein
MTAIFFGLLSVIVFPLILYVAIEGETSDTQIMDRAEAERQVQQRSGVEQSRSRGEAERD